MSHADVEAGVRAGLEAAVKATELPGNRWDAQDRILALDPAAIAATVAEQDDMVRVDKDGVWLRRDCTVIATNELAALRQRIAELERQIAEQSLRP